MRVVWCVALTVAALAVGCNQQDGGNKSNQGQLPGNTRTESVPGANNGSQPLPGENEVTTEIAGGGETATYRGELPPDWPGQIQLYPDGALGETAMATTPQGQVFSAEMMTTASTDTVADFYRQQFEAENAHISEITRSPTIANETYYCPDYLVTLMSEQTADGTKVSLMVQPPAGPDQVLPTIRQYIDLDRVPEGFPEDLIPRYPGSRIVNGYTDGLGFYSAEMVTTDDLPTVAGYYLEHFAALEWTVMDSLEQDIVRTYTLSKNGDRATLNVGAGGDGENHISISYRSGG